MTEIRFPVLAPEAMTDEQRAELIALGCGHCGSLDPRCYCQRDD